MAGAAELSGLFHFEHNLMADYRFIKAWSRRV
jgi:hypothetical protein